MEIWKPIPWASRYFVSDQGQVRGASGRILKQTIMLPAPGYLGVGIASDDVHDRSKRRANGRMGVFRVHRLVLEAFNGPAPAGHEGAHLNGISTDNRLENLAWVTHAENEFHQFAHGTARPRAKISEDDVVEIKSLISTGMSQASIAKKYGINQSQISRINTGGAW